MPAPDSLAEIAKYFRGPGQSLSDFSKEWKTLPDKDKDDIRKGFADGSMTY